MGILCLLGLLFTLFLLVIFMPIVYRFEGDFSLEDMESAYGQLRISWFGKLFHGHLRYINKELSYEGKILWYHAITNDEETLKKKEEKRKKKEYRKKKKEQKKNSKQLVIKDASKEDNQKELITKQELKSEEIKSQENKGEEIEGQEIKSQEIKTQEIEGQVNKDQELQDKIIQVMNQDNQKSEQDIKAKKKKVFFPRFFIAFYKRKISKIKEKLSSFHPIKKLKEWNKKRDRLWQWWNFNSTKAAIKNVKKYIKKVLKVILPNHLKGRIAFGFDDPALTGKVLGVGAMGYPIYKEHIKWVPDFYEKRLEASLKGSGYIQLYVFLGIGLQALFDKNLKRTIKQFQKITGGQ